MEIDTLEKFQVDTCKKQTSYKMVDRLGEKIRSSSEYTGLTEKKVHYEEAE